MVVDIPTCKPFSLAQALTFMSRFPACANEALIAGDRATIAVVASGRAYAVTMRERRGALVIDVDDDAPADVLARKTVDLLGAADDLHDFYTAAKRDRHFAPIVDSLHGLHHVRFIGGLPEIAVYSVLMQRASILQAARYKVKFLDRFGLRVQHANHTLRAMPELDALARLDASDVAGAIGHAGKAARIVDVVRGVAKLGEPFLREAPYAAARDALLAIPGIGPFSAGAILLRGLGRMDELPLLDIVEREARAVYGRAWDPGAIARRYGKNIGYWSFYLKTGAARGAALATSSSSIAPAAGRRAVSARPLCRSRG